MHATVRLLSYTFEKDFCEAVRQCVVLIAGGYLQLQMLDKWAP